MVTFICLILPLENAGTLLAHISVQKPRGKTETRRERLDRMHAQAFDYEVANGMANDLDPVELLNTVMSLRQDVSSISGDVREVLKENARLKKEVSRLQNRRKSTQSVSEIKRMKNELDQMMNMHDAMSSGRAKSVRAPRQQESLDDSGSAANSSWMKKMMMFMMLAEMA